MQNSHQKKTNKLLKKRLLLVKSGMLIGLCCIVLAVSATSMRQDTAQRYIVDVKPVTTTVKTNAESKPADSTGYFPNLSHFPSWLINKCFRLFRTS